MDLAARDERDVEAWPFTGRATELASGTTALERRRGAIVFGGGGVGKSRLARELIAGQRERDWLAVVGTEGTGDVAFGAWAHLLPEGRSRLDDVDGWRALAAALRGPDGIIRLLVEDAHWLDLRSAGLLHHLIATEQAHAVITSRRDPAPASPITSLWKDGHLTRIDLERLTIEETGALVEAALGAPIEPRTAASLHDRSGGDLHLVRELVDESRRHGSLRLVHGAWVEVTTSRPGPRVVDLLAGRIEALGPHERAAAELIAVAAPIDARVLARAVAPAVVDQLIAADLVAFEHEDGQRSVSLADPVLGDVLVERMAPRRREELLGALIDLFAERAAELDEEGAVRSIEWQIELGRPIDPDAAEQAADVASARNDFATAERLASAAVDAGGGLSATIRLGEALTHQQLHREAERVLSPVGDRLAELDDDLRFRYADARTLALSTDLGLLDEAIAMLEATIGTMADDRSRWALEARLSFLLADCGRLADARPLAEARLANVAEDEPSALTAFIAGGLIRTYSGRCQDTLDLCEAMVPVALRHGDDRPEALAWIGAAQMLATYVRGDLQEAQDLCETMEVLIGDDRDPTVRAGLLMSQGLVQSDRGLLDRSLRLLHQAAALHEVDNRRGYQSWCLAITARVHALRGELDEGDAALALARHHLWPGGQSFEGDIHVAAVWLATLRGNRDDALAILDAAVAAAEREGRETMALRLRHEAIRAGLPMAPHVEAFARSTVVEQSLMARVLVRHVAALHADDGAGLVAAGERFAGLGAHLLSAEAYAQGAGAHRRAGSPTLAVQAKQLSERQRSRCEAAATPALRFGDLVVGLTDRELDVTTRAAAGQANQEIADGLGISVRTAETHLQRAFAKLGIHRRGELAALFGPGRPATSA